MVQTNRHSAPDMGRLSCQNVCDQSSCMSVVDDATRMLTRSWHRRCSERGLNVQGSRMISSLVTVGRCNAHDELNKCASCGINLVTSTPCPRCGNCKANYVPSAGKTRVRSHLATQILQLYSSHDVAVGNHSSGAGDNHPHGVELGLACPR